MSRTNISKRDQASLRTASVGTRDIVNMLEQQEIQPLLEPLILAVLDRIDNVAAPSMAHPSGDLGALLARLRTPAPPTVDVASAVLDGRVDDLSAYDDAVLLAPLVIPPDYVPQSLVDRWVDHNLPTTLVKDLDKLKDDLERLPHTDAEAWPLLVAGRLKEALLLGRPFAGCTDDDTRRIVRNVALLFHAAATRMRGALIRRWTTQPLGGGVRYETGWSYVGRTLNTALVDPAAQIALMLRQLQSDPDAAVTGTWLERSSVIDMARGVEGRFLARSGRHSFKDALQHLQSAIRPLACITPDQVRNEGLGMRDFVEQRLGVPASFACVLLACSFLEAPRQIDACIHAVRCSGPLPSIGMPRFNIDPGGLRNRSLVRTTRWLRLTARTDRHAFSGGNGDVNDKVASQLVKKALASFRQTPPTAAHDELHVDPRVWFA